MTTSRQTNDNPNRSANTTPSAGLVPPHNLDAEMALLGAALLAPSANEILATKVVPGDFYSPAHGQIAAALIQAFERNHPADVVTIADALKRQGLLESIGGPGYLLSLQTNTPATSNAGQYAAIIHNDATLRRLIQASVKTSEMAHSRPFDVHEAVERAQTFLTDVASQNGSRSYSSLDMPNMADIIAGDIIQEQPSILMRDDGQALFYAGKMHVLQAEPSSGKSWIALFSAMEILNVGGAVVYLDYEDSSGGIVGRLLALGADPESISTRFQYVRPSGPMGTAEKAELAALLRRLNPDLLILDGVAEAISRDGFDEDKNTDVVKWIDQFPRWVAETGVCVVMIDHVSKDSEKAGRYARGAGHKLAAVDGASYQVKIIRSFSRHRGGSVKLVVAKDRPGVFTIGEVAAIVGIEPSADGTVVRLEVKRLVETHEEDSWKPTHIMERMSFELERSVYPLTANSLMDVSGAGSRKKMYQEALARLKQENFVSTYRIGPTTYLRSYRRYRAGDRPIPPEAEQQTLAKDWKTHEDELAKRRAQREAEDPGPVEPTD